MVYFGVGGSVLIFYLWVFVLECIMLICVVILVIVNLIMVLLVGVWLFDEFLRWNLVVGILVVFVGIWLVMIIGRCEKMEEDFVLCEW